MRGKKYFAVALAAASAVCAFGAVQTADAQAGQYCNISGTQYTNGGNSVTYRGAYANGMNCASVRYAHSQFRAKIRRQWGHPRMPRAFWDGWVTWSCWNTSRHGIKCWEPQSGTSYTFRAYVR